MSDRGRGRGRGDHSLPFNPRGRGGGRGDFGPRGGGRGDFGGGRGRGRGAPVEVQVHTQGEAAPPAPDRYVEQFENSSMISLKGKKPDDEMPHRPGYGKLGKPVVLWTNYFKLVTQKGLELYRYNMTIAPDSNGRVPVGKKVKRIVQLLLEENFYPQGLDIATDFKSTLYSRQKLKLETDYTINYRSELEDEAPENPRQYRIRLEATGSLTVAQLIDHLTSTQAGHMFGSKEEIIQALNIVLGHHPKASAGIATVASNRHFDMNTGQQGKTSLGAGLNVIRGFFMSVRAVTAQVLLNVQVKHIAMFDDGPLEGLMRAYMHDNGPSKPGLLKFVKKLSIDVTHIPRKNRKGERIPRIKNIAAFATKDDGRKLSHPPRIKEFGAGPKDVEFFLDTTPAGKAVPGALEPSGAGKKGKKPSKAGPAPLSQGRYISVYDFFKQTHGIICRDLSLPVINVATRDNPSYLPVDVANVLPGQPARSKLSPLQTQQMIKFAVRRPHMNAQSIVTSGGHMLGFDPTNPTLKAFDTKVTPKLITVSGRVLPSPGRINYAGTQTTSPRLGSWNMQSVKFVTQSTLQSWTFLRISLEQGRSPWQRDQDFSAKLDDFQTKLRALGITATNFMSGQHIRVNSQNVEPQIEEAVGRFVRHPSRPKLIFVIIPAAQATIVYNYVKHICDVKLGVLNVCVWDSKFVGANDQYFANVALKFNLKLGGRNHSIDPQLLGFIQQKETMVVGIDVTHPSPGSVSTAPSVAGIVASVDAWLAQWPADIRIQTAREEMVAGLDIMFKSRLDLWKKKNGKLPKSILIYRDGVSEGQYNLVLEKELPALRKACVSVYPATDTKAGLPLMTIVIVGKRHNIRFYPTKKDEADRGGNPMNGTVVDRGVTEARNWDFFLQAHAAIQGTARPAHYYVVYDQIFKNTAKLPAKFATAADALEDITHNMCYLFGRATKAVSICPPAYYADLVCERARCYLSSLYDPSPLASPDASTAGTSTADPSQGPNPALVAIHPNVKDTMFYI